LTDIHIDPYYQTAAPANCERGILGLRCCKADSIPLPSSPKCGAWGNFNCDSPSILWTTTLDFIQSELPYPIDFVIYTGDAVGHHLLDQSFSANMATFLQASLDLSSRFQVFPAVGNHDTWPINQFPESKDASWLTSRYYRAFEPSLRDYGGNWSSTVLEGGFYSILYKPKLRFIVLNSLTEEGLNFVKHDAIQDRQRRWLEITLEESKKNGETVWLIGHIFPGASEATSSYTPWLCDILSTYSSIIRYSFWGHTHSDTFRVYSSGTNVFGAALMPGSLIPDDHQPTFRVFSYDEEDMTLTDYIQYQANLAWMTEHSKVNYKEAYRAKSYYNLPSLEKNAWYKLYSTIQTNSTLFRRVYSASQVGNPMVSPCDPGSTCAKDLINELRVC